MTTRDILDLGVPRGPAVGAAVTLAERDPAEAPAIIERVLADPVSHHQHHDPLVRAFAHALVPPAASQAPDGRLGDRGLRDGGLRDDPAPYRIFGEELIDPEAILQMDNAMRLPGAIVGALMPDAHVGYGLPIGGVMALEGGEDPSGPTGLRGHISPYAVGVDIGCSMHLTIFDAAPDAFKHEELLHALLEHTAFGTGVPASGRVPDHELLQREEWREQPFLRDNPKLHTTARAQLGSSGGGNHFASFCRHTGDDDMERLALLTHSGSRGLGARIAEHYSDLALRSHPDLPRDVRHLAWLDLDSTDGFNYWTLMQLAGDYATANHEVIHERISEHLGLLVHQHVGNRHNFAWLEQVTTPDGQQQSAIVHRKGATPAGKGTLGIVPGSMATPAYVVRGKGNPASLNSAAHGAGRVMSRGQARRAFRGRDLSAELAAKGITLVGSGLDEAPEAYKSVEEVMRHQTDLIETVARLDPLVVRMAGR